MLVPEKYTINVYLQYEIIEMCLEIYPGKQGPHSSIAFAHTRTVEFETNGGSLLLVSQGMQSLQ
jgi:hypothetical protein